MVPPTDVSEIPQEFFAAHPEYQSQEFNVFQTWTEYVNRLIGALIGLFAFATAALSFVYWKKDKRVVFWPANEVKDMVSRGLSIRFVVQQENGNLIEALVDL